MERGALAQRWRYLIFYLTVLLFMLSSIFARTDTAQPELFPQTFGPSLNGTEGQIQATIDQLSKQLAADPYKAELYYYLARAYIKQGWHDKAAQYISQWIKLSNSDVVMKDSYAFVLDEKNDKVRVIDITTKKVVQEIDVGWLPKRMIPTPDGVRLYVTNALANNVSAINTEKIAVTKTIKTGLMPWNGKSSPQGDRVYVTNLKSDDVSVINTENDTVLETVKVGKGPWGVAVSPDGHRLYISNQDSRNIQVIDTGSYSIVDVIDVGTHPRDIALAPDDKKKLYAVDKDIVSDEVEIYVVDLEDARIVDALSVPATDDPLLSRFEKMSVEDKLALIAHSDKPDAEVQKRIAKPGLGNLPQLVLVPRSLSSLIRSVTDKDTMPESAKLPMGGPTILMDPKPAAETYVKIPPASSGKPIPLQEQRKFTLGPVKLPTGSAAVSIKTEPVTEVYANVPSAPRRKDFTPPVAAQSRTLPLLESKPAARTSATEKQEKRTLRIIVVVKRDTLWSIAMNNYGTANNSIIKAIKAMNPQIKDVNKIYAGQEIKLPTMDANGRPVDKTVVVKPKDNLFRIALENYGVVDERIYAAILKANPDIKDISKIEAGQKIILPALSSISS